MQLWPLRILLEKDTGNKKTGTYASINIIGTSLVVQWLRFHATMQRAHVPRLVGELDPTWYIAHPNYIKKNYIVNNNNNNNNTDSFVNSLSIFWKQMPPEKHLQDTSLLWAVIFKSSKRHWKSSYGSALKRHFDFWALVTGYWLRLFNGFVPGLPGCLCHHQGSECPSAWKLDLGTFSGWCRVQPLAVLCCQWHGMFDSLQHHSETGAAHLQGGWRSHLHLLLLQAGAAWTRRGKAPPTGREVCFSPTSNDSTAPLGAKDHRDL